MTDTLQINPVALGSVIRRELARMLRVPIQSLVAPFVSALLLVFIFGFVVGGQISHVKGLSYVEFVLPGILMVNIVNAAFTQASLQFFASRFMKYIEEFLVAPLSYLEIVIGSLSVVMFRCLLTGLGILGVGLLLGVSSVQDLAAFLFWNVAISIVFGLLGIIVGLWAPTMEHLSLPAVFIVTPLSMVGGVFSTADMLPAWLQWTLYFNPFFYFSSGIREAMTGYAEVSSTTAALVTLGLAAALLAAVLHILKRGYGVRP
jgi:ABC-2 type transport system permease protein